MADGGETGLQLRSLFKDSGELELSLTRVPVGEPGPDEIVVKVEASPINPSDLGLLLGAADVAGAKVSGTEDAPVVTAPVPPAFAKMMAPRAGHSLPVGNEGSGVVVKAGSSGAAQALLGRTVAILGGAMYAQYRTVKAAEALALPAGVTPAEGASCFVNPLTALGMIGTMRLEGHKALVHTAAGSNLGQMLVKACKADGVPLINIVRSAEQEALLRGLGATHVCDSSKPGFIDALTAALVETGATLAFDAIGGGRLAGQILTAMEAALTRTPNPMNRYGSTTHKQVYIYGGLNTGPTEFNRGFGMAWGMGGWLLPYFIEKIGPAEAQKLRERVAAEIKTTFASRYSHVISLAEALKPEVMAAYNRKSTGDKYLIAPHRSA